MESLSKLVPALQIEDDGVLPRVVEHLLAAGIAAKAEAIADIPPNRVPDWSQPDRGGWLLLIDRERVKEGMAALQDVMGYSPD